MNSKALWGVVILLVAQALLNSASARAAESSEGLARDNTTVELVSLKGKVRIEGTSNLDDWRVESRSLEGFMRVTSGFPIHTATSPLPARVEAWLEVRSLKSIEKDGKPFSNKMDEIMYDALRSKENARIVYRLNRLEPKPGSKRANAPTEFEAQGQLVVAGVTNELSMRVNVLQLRSGQIKVSGATGLKMTTFHIEPPAPKIALGLIRTDDEVKLSFEWVLIARR
jgi:hypothetical protein